MSDITLSSGIRQNLLALQNTSNDLNTTQNQLSTGKKVNTAFDNPQSFFTSQSLTNRSNDLSALLDQIGQAQQTLNAANDGLTGLTSLLEQALSTAQQAAQSTTGTVNYSGTQTGTAIANDTTQATSANVFNTAIGALSGTQISTQSSSQFLTAGLAQLTTGDTLTYSLSGTTVTATYGGVGSNDSATNTFADLAGLDSVLTSGGLGNLSAVAQVTNAGGAVKVLGNNLTDNITTSSTIAGGPLSGANFQNNTVNAHLGDPLTIADGEGHSSTFYYVAANAKPANNTFTSDANLATAISDSNLSSSITPTVNGAGNLVLSSPDGGVTVSGALGTTDLGFSPTTYKNNYNSTLAGLASGSTLTVQVGTDAVNTLTFGSGNGQIATLAGLNSALSAFSDITATVNAQNKIVLTPTSTNLVTIGGTAGTVTSLGFASGTTTPTATVVTPSSTRATLQSNYNALLTQIDQLAGDSSYNGVNLLNSNNLKVNFNENGTSGLTIAGVNFSSSGLGLSTISGNGFQDNTNITNAQAAINNAITNVRAQTETFGTNSSTISTRQTFETNLINTLQTGASNLVLADQNEASANLLTEQTQQQLEISALSIANQANQSVLKLFG
ncbi:MAG: flagellin [Xanthobacteraceae bacterium]